MDWIQQEGYKFNKMIIQIKIKLNKFLKSLKLDIVKDGLF